MKSHTQATDIEERLAQLNREWQRKFEEREKQWKRHLHELGEKMHAMINVICEF